MHLQSGRDRSALCSRPVVTKNAMICTFRSPGTVKGEAGRMKWGETWDALGGGQKLGLSVVGAILIVVLIVVLVG